VGFGIDRRARCRKGRGLFRKAPDPREVADRLGRLARRSLKGAVTRAGWAKDRYVLELALFAGAPTASLTVEPAGDIVLRGETAPLGPGYHAELAARVDPLLSELDYTWEDSLDDAQVARAMCEWLAGELRTETKQLRLGASDARQFVIDAPVLTPLGPRDAAWKAAVLADPMAARDAFPWWQRGPGREELARALVAMWLEVPWREPLDKEERELVERVDADLRAARKASLSASVTLPLPWGAWKELLVHLGIEDDDVSAKASTEAANQAANDGRAIGYRRHDLEIEVSGGWCVKIPGAMVGNYEEDGEKYWATDGERAIELATLTANEGIDSDALLAIAPEAHPVIARISEGERRGRAEAFVDGGTPILIGIVAQAPHVAILTCKGGEQEWALATWRSLRQLG
jgi:hypothetical protein